MKKNSIIVVAFLALLASCSKEHLGTDTTGSKTYQFETSVGGVKNTKGMPKSAWKIGDVMALYGLDMDVFSMTETPEKWTFVGSQNADGNMTPMFCYDAAGNGTWNYGAPVAWYEDVITSFIAIYPSTAAEYGTTGLTTTPATASDIAIDYTVVGGYADAATPTDIATARGQIKKQTDLLVALTKDVVSTTTTIPLNFQHALSQVRFNVLNASTTQAELLRVEDITISGILTKGRFVFAGNEDQSAPAFIQWTGQSEAQNFKVNLRNENVNSIEAGKSVEAVDYDDESLIMIPQIFPAGASITVRYSYSSDGGTTWGGASASTKQLSDFKTRLEPNKCYTFTVSITAASNSVSFAPPVVNPWTADGEVELN